MSILSDFVAIMSPIARDVIGAESLSIAGGTAISGTPNQASYSRDYEDGGFEPEAMLDFVVATADFTAAYPLAGKSYLGKAATLREQSWRVSGVSTGIAFVTVSLTSTNKSA